MDKLVQYRGIIRRVIAEDAGWRPSNGQIDLEAAEDSARDHFELLAVGWDAHRRVHHTILHLDIIDGKVWVQHDATDRPVAEALVAAGIPKSDIVIGFHPADLRQHTEFAVG